MDSRLILAPEGWQLYKHPEGQPYFCHPELNVVTECNVIDPTISSRIEAAGMCIKRLAQATKSISIRTMEIFIDVDSRNNPQGELYYYAVDRQDCTVFWVTDGRSDDPELSLRDVSSEAHMGTSMSTWMSLYCCLTEDEYLSSTKASGILDPCRTFPYASTVPRTNLKRTYEYTLPYSIWWVLAYLSNFKYNNTL